MFQIRQSISLNCTEKNKYKYINFNFLCDGREYQQLF